MRVLRRALLLVVAGTLLSSTVALAQPRPPIDESKAVNLGPNGGDILRIAIAPSDPNTIFALGSYGGIFLSTDGGTTWVSRSSRLRSRDPISHLSGGGRGTHHGAG